MAADDLVYPFATQSGEAIPLDIINPEGLIIQAFTAVANTPVAAITGLDIAMFIASQGCIVQFGAEIPIPAVDGTKYDDAIVIPAGVVVSVQCPAESFYVRGLSESGTLYVQMVRRWAGLALPKQFSRK